jgi:acetolactate synthase-1/2/3 large subunit
MYKPVILIGAGCRYNPALVEHLCRLNIPVLTTWPAIELVAEDNPAFCGRAAIYGQRAANIIQQKADAIYCFGARMDYEQVAYRYDNFAPRAVKVIYDVDQAELDKLPDDWRKIKIDLTTCKDRILEKPNPDTEWLSWCKALYNRFRPELDGKVGDFIDPFYFYRILGDLCKPDDVLATGSSGIAANSFFQTFKIKKGQREVNCSTIGAMGVDIPAAIGACIGSGKRRTICCTGDGSFMLNVQELEVVRRLNLPITFFVFSNNGYASIRNMQNARFDGRHVGCDPNSGLTLPSLEKIVKGFDITFNRYTKGDYLENLLSMTMKLNGPQVREVMIDPNYTQLPRVASPNYQSDSMENMTPYLDPAELKELMDYGN